MGPCGAGGAGVGGGVADHDSAIDLAASGLYRFDEVPGVWLRRWGEVRANHTVEKGREAQGVQNRDRQASELIGADAKACTSDL